MLINVFKLISSNCANYSTMQLINLFYKLYFGELNIFPSAINLIFENLLVTFFIWSKVNLI